jgi:hypothetical protein
MKMLNKIKFWWLFKVLKKPLSTARLIGLTLKRFYKNFFHKILIDRGFNIKKKQIKIDFSPIRETDVERFRKLI